MNQILKMNCIVCGAQTGEFSPFKWRLLTAGPLGGSCNVFGIKSKRHAPQDVRKAFLALKGN